MTWWGIEYEMARAMRLAHERGEVMAENGLSKLWRSKRFWSALGSLIAAAAFSLLEIDIDPEWIVGIGMALVGGYAIEDARRAGNDAESGGGNA